MLRRINLSILSCIAVVAIFLGVSTPLFAAPVIGEAAPAFTTNDSNGNSVSLHDYRGKPVVLEWYNADCPYVRKHYDTKNMQKLQQEFIEKGVAWLVVNSSAPGKQGHLTAESGNEQLKKEGATPTALLLDPEGIVGKLYDAKTTPHMYVIDAKGMLVYNGAIDDNNSSRTSSVEEANNYVSAALRAVLEGAPVQTASSEPYGCSVKYKG